MNTNRRKHEVCHECEQALIDEMNRLAGTGEGSPPKRHMYKSRELHEAFTERRTEIVKRYARYRYPADGGDVEITERVTVTKKR